MPTTTNSPAPTYGATPAMGAASAVGINIPAPPSPGQQPGQMPGQTSPSQAPDQTTPSAQQPEQPTPGAQDQSAQAAANAAGTQMFSGTIVKTGDKYVFQDAASGKTYDIDHQDQVKNYEGKRVRVKGTLDSNNTIHIQ